MKAISLQMEHQRNMCVALTLKYFFLSNAKAAIIFLRIYVVVVVISFRFHAFTFFSVSITPSVCMWGGNTF